MSDMTELRFIAQWTVSLFLLGLAAAPLTRCLFRKFDDRGWLFSKTLGLLLCGGVLWALNVPRLIPFTGWTTRAIVLAFACVVWGASLWRGRRKADGAVRPQIAPKSVRLRIFRFQIMEEVSFLLLFLFGVYLVGFNPWIKGTEKFMDYGFITSMMRGEWLPFQDMWLSGQAINYYYGGHYFVAFLTKLSGVPAGYAHNFMRSTLTTLSIVLPFSIGYQLMRDKRGPASRAPRLAGTLTGIATGLAGNGQYLVYGLFLRTYQYYTGQKMTYWYADSTRYISGVPEAEKNIHEFPAYASVVGDLHAHYINTIFVLTVIGLLYAWSREQEDRSAPFGRSLCEIALMGAIVGLFQWTHYWDYPIYLVVCGTIILFHNIRRCRAECRLGLGLKGGLEGEGWPENVPEVENVAANQPEVENAAGSQPATVSECASVVAGNSECEVAVEGQPVTVPEVEATAESRPEIAPRPGFKKWRLIGRWIGITFCQAAVLLLCSRISALPFTEHFKMISSKVRFTHSHSPIYQMVIVWGFPLFAFLALSIWLWRAWRRDRQNTRWGQEGLIRWSDLSVFLLCLCAAGLVLMPELVYVVDIYSGVYYRANTMFKLAYQAFILFAVSVPYVLVRAFMSRNALVERYGTFAIAVLIAMSNFSIHAGSIVFGDIFDPSRRLTSDGSTFIEKYYPGDAGAVAWMQENIKGQPVVLEATGESFTDYCRMSVATGLPTIIGWRVHEWLWNSDKRMPARRMRDVDNIYTSTSRSRVMSLLKRYNVDYIYVGEMERKRYPKKLNLDLLTSLGDVVCSEFHNGKKNILIKVRRP